MSRQMSGKQYFYETDYKHDDTLVKQLTEQKGRNGKLQEKIDELNKTIKNQSEIIGILLGKDIEIRAKGKFNTVCEIVQPTSLSHNIREIFDKEWRNVMTTCFRGDRELEGIQFLSKLLQECLTFCEEKAREQLLDFVNPCSDKKSCLVEEVIQSEEEQHNLYKLRRIIGLYERNKLHVIELFVNKCKEKGLIRYRFIKKNSDNINCLETRQKLADSGKDLDNEETIIDGGDTFGAEGEVDHGTIDGATIRVTSETEVDYSEEMNCIEEYIRKCCDICWQCAICDPAVLLKFDVIGKNFEHVSDKFHEYHYNGETNERGACNEVMQVVWPAVVIRDEEEHTDVLIDNAKGSVILCRSSSV